MKPTIHDLRKLLSVPDPEQSSQSPSVEPSEADKSARPIWTQPIPKLVAGTILLMPVFIVAGLFLIGSESDQPITANSPSPNGSSKPTETETEALRQENASLKAKAALEGQQQLEKQLTNQSQPKSKSKQSPKSSTVVAKTPTSSSIAIQSPHRQSPHRVVATTSRPEPIATRAVDFSSRDRLPSLKAMTQSEAVNSPEERWQQLAKLGSYGAAPEALTQPEHSRVNQTTALVEEGESNSHLESKVEIDAKHNSEEIIPTIAVKSLETEPIRPKATHSKPLFRPILDVESQALNENAAQSTAIMAGSSSPGVLVTPLILDEIRTNRSTHDRNTQFTVALVQPLKDAASKTVLPTNTQLQVRVDDVSSTGRVRLSAIAAMWMQNGSMQSIKLPSNVIQIRAKDGNSLIVPASEDKGKEIAALDAGQFFLGAVREASGQFTRSDTQIQAGNGTTIVTQANQRPNLLAGVLKGGTDAILDSISERNRRTTEEIQSRPVTRIIEAGQPVQVFINQTLQFSS